MFNAGTARGVKGEGNSRQRQIKIECALQRSYEGKAKASQAETNPLGAENLPGDSLVFGIRFVGKVQFAEKFNKQEVFAYGG